MISVVALDAIGMRCLPSSYGLGLLRHTQGLTLTKMDTDPLGKPTGFLGSNSKGYWFVIK